MKSIITILPLFAALLIAGCGNPAENVAPAEVKDAAPVSKASVSKSQTYLINVEQSTLGFVGSKVTGSHDGGFKSFKGGIAVADGNIIPESSAVTIDMASLWADHPKLTAHLASPDFFNTAEFPESTFVFSDVKAGEGNAVTVTGNLTLHGVTKSITFPATAEVSDDSVSLNAEFVLNRIDFGIVYPGKKDDLIRKEVVIKLAIDARK